MNYAAPAAESQSSWTVPHTATRVLIIAPGAEARLQNDIGLDVHLCRSGEGSAAAMQRIAPDMLVLDPRLVDLELIDALTGEIQPPKVLLLVDADTVDLAAWALALPDVIIASSAGPGVDLRRTIRDLAARGFADIDGTPAIRRLPPQVDEAHRAPQEAPEPDAATIRALLRARRARDRFFASDLFSDPAWDMLLDLAAARLEGRQVSVSSLCIAAAVPTTTALRWIKRMCDDGLLVRIEDPADRRRAFIAMSDATSAAMTACLRHLMAIR